MTFIMATEAKDAARLTTALRSAFKLMVVNKGFATECEVEQSLIENIDVMSVLISLVEQNKEREDVSSAHELMFDRFSQGANDTAGASVMSPKKPRLDSSSRTGFARRAKGITDDADRPDGEDVLKRIEATKKDKWVEKLVMISKKAAKFLEGRAPPEGINEAEFEELSKVVLSTGAHKTIKGHVKAWQRIERWARSSGIPEEKLYPMSTQTMIQLVNDKMKANCGPSVIPALRATVAWISRRLSMQQPDLKNEFVIAIENKVIEERGQELRKAIAFPIDLVKAAEGVVAAWEDLYPAFAVFLWFVLCMIYASLRFDDALHVKRATLEWREEGLFGSCWQTKVERKRRGTKFAVPNVSLSDEPWLAKGWQIFNRMVPEGRDYWMPKIVDEHTLDDSGPMTYEQFVFMQREVFEYVSAVNNLGMKDIIKKLTAHSSRVTMLDAATQSGEGMSATMAQANWKSTTMPLEYTRCSKTVAVDMIRSLTKKMKKGWRPSGPASTLQARQDDPEDASDDFEGDEAVVYIKSARGSGHDFKYHYSSSIDPGLLACNKRGLQVKDCEPVGLNVPDSSMLCKDCVRARIDLRKFE
jgi:hypothetical protein